MADFEETNFLPMGAPVPMGGAAKKLDHIRILIIPVRCKGADPNSADPISKEELRKAFFGDLLRETNGERASVADYLRATSFGAVREVNGEVADWVILDKPFGSYVPEHWLKAGYPYPARQFYTSALQEVDRRGNVKFKTFDDDGPNSNIADDDGYVDIVVFISGDSEFDRGHRWQLSYVSDYNPFFDDFVGPWESSQTTTVRNETKVNVDGTTQVKVDDFAMIPFRDMVDGRIGVACHEILHFIGLPDAYARGNSKLGGVGNWCVMGRGCHEKTRNSAGSSSARWPVLLSAPCRYFLGWGTRCECLPDSGTRALDSRHDGAYTVIKPHGKPEEEGEMAEVCFVESYSAPTQKSPWGKNILPEDASGYLVWHVDGSVGRAKTMKSLSWPFSATNAGQNDFAYAAGANFSASAVERPLVRCVQADGNLDIESDPNGGGESRNFADASDLFRDHDLLQFNNRIKGFTWYRHHTAEPAIAFASGVIRASLIAVAPPQGFIPPVGAPPQKTVGAANPAGSQGSPSTANAQMHSTGEKTVLGVTSPPQSVPSVVAGEEKPLVPELAAEPVSRNSGNAMQPGTGMPAMTIRSTGGNAKVGTGWIKHWERVASGEKDSPFRSQQDFELFKQRAEQYLTRYEGQAPKVKKDLITVLSAASSSNLKSDSELLEQLSTASSASVQEVSAILEPDIARILNKEWRAQRTYDLKRKNAALASLNQEAAQATRVILEVAELKSSPDGPAALVRAPDGNSVEELRRLHIPMLPNAESPVDDVEERIQVLNGIAGIENPNVSLKIAKSSLDAGRPTKEGNQRVWLSYQAKIGDQEVPLATARYWGDVTYDPENNLQTVKFNEPLRVGKLPEELAPALTAQQAIDIVYGHLRVSRPPKESIKAELQLFPVGPKDSPEWKASYRIALPLPNGATNDIYVDAMTGQRLQ
jgi:M6 family metalloprotease-like protein